MDPSMDQVNQAEISVSERLSYQDPASLTIEQIQESGISHPGAATSVLKQKGLVSPTYSEHSSASSLTPDEGVEPDRNRQIPPITKNDRNPQIPPIKRNDIYKIGYNPLLIYKAATQIRISSIDICFSAVQDEPTIIPLLDPKHIKWAIQHKFKYVHLGGVRFGLNALVSPHLNIFCVCVVVDTRRKQLSDAIIGGFIGSFHDGPIFSTIFPNFTLDLDDPCIFDAIQVYVLPNGFNMVKRSKNLRLKSYVCARFGNDKEPALQKSVSALRSSRLISTLESTNSRNSQPNSFDWRGIEYPYPTIWETHYQRLLEIIQNQKNVPSRFPKIIQA